MLGPGTDVGGQDIHEQDGEGAAFGIVRKRADDEQEETTYDVAIPLLRFDESGWCSALNRAYSRGLYRPKDADEYIALKKYAAEEIYA